MSNDIKVRYTAKIADSGMGCNHAHRSSKAAVKCGKKWARYAYKNDAYPFFLSSLDSIGEAEQSVEVEKCYPYN